MSIGGGPDTSGNVTVGASLVSGALAAGIFNLSGRAPRYCSPTITPPTPAPPSPLPAPPSQGPLAPLTGSCGCTSVSCPISPARPL